MDGQRREKIRMLIRLLEPFGEEVRHVLFEEEDKFGNRTEASKENESGQVSSEAVRCLGEAVDGIENAVFHMQVAIGDASLPEIPQPPTKIRRV
jgi:hypothetical protein